MAARPRLCRSRGDTAKSTGHVVTSSRAWDLCSTSACLRGQTPHAWGRCRWLFQAPTSPRLDRGVAVWWPPVSPPWQSSPSGALQLPGHLPGHRRRTLGTAVSPPGAAGRWVLILLATPRGSGTNSPLNTGLSGTGKDYPAGAGVKHGEWQLPPGRAGTALCPRPMGAWPPARCRPHTTFVPIPRPAAGWLIK